MKWKLPSQILAALAASFLLGGYPLAAYGNSEIVVAVVAGALLGTLNVFLGYLAIEYGFDKSIVKFMKAVIGGMGIRLVLLLGAMLVLITIAGLHASALTASLFYFYVLFLVLEILYIQKKA